MRALIGLLSVAVIGSGCGHNIDDCRNTLTCPPPPDAGVIVIVSDAGVPCDGVCAPIAGESLGWARSPFLLARSKSTEVPETQCPDNAPTPTFQGYANPDQTLACPSCACAPPTGECHLPETVMASPSPVCPDDGDAGVPFDPPSGWDGGCTANDAIVDVDCDGGTCVQSVTAGALTVTESCAPVPAIVPKDVKWSEFGRACEGQANGTCPDAGEVCVPRPPEHYQLCVSRVGDDAFYACPQGYPLRYIYYQSATDNRACAPCTCDPPEGSTCASLVSFYSDDACAEQIASVTSTAASSMCAQIPPGSPLGSKQASPPVYTPGSCKPGGGGEVGSVKPTHPVTFCCQE